MNTELSKDRVTEAKGTGHISRKLNALEEMAGVQDCPSWAVSGSLRMSVVATRAASVNLRHTSLITAN